MGQFLDARTGLEIAVDGSLVNMHTKGESLEDVRIVSHGLRGKNVGCHDKRIYSAGEHWPRRHEHLHRKTANLVHTVCEMRSRTTETRFEPLRPWSVPQYAGSSRGGHHFRAALLLLPVRCQHRNSHIW